MKKLALLGLLGLRFMAHPAYGAVTLCHACDNIASHRLAGTWEIVPDLTERLTPIHAGAPGLISITADASVLSALPAEIESALGTSPVFLAGTLQFADARFVFLMIERAGNLILLCFRPGAPPSYAHPIAILFTVVPATEARNDLLFLGSEKETQPFYAYERAEQHPLSPDTQKLLQQALVHSHSPQLDEALQRLPEQPDWQAVVDGLLDALRIDPNSVNNNRLIVLRAIVERHLDTVRLDLAPLLAVLESPSWTNQQKTSDLLKVIVRRPELLNGMEKSVVRALIPLTTSQRGLVVQPALDLLHQLTGKRDLQRDPETWAHWFATTYGEPLDLSHAVYEQVAVISGERDARGSVVYRLNGARVGNLEALSQSVGTAVTRARDVGLRPSFVVLVSHDITSAETQEAAMRESAPVRRVLEQRGIGEYTLTPKGTPFYAPFKPKSTASPPGSLPSTSRERSGKLCAGAATWCSPAAADCASAAGATSAYRTEGPVSGPVNAAVP